MKPNDALFEVFSKNIESVTPALYAHEVTRSLTTDILGYVREHGTSISLPRLGHYRTALQRVMNPEGLVIPDGKIYKTATYEDFTIGSEGIEYESKLLVLTTDKDNTKGRLTNVIDKVMDDYPSHKGVFVVFGIATPKETPNITSVNAITFAVVQSNSGEAYGFSFNENPNKGKVRATEGMSDEWGGIRDRYGHFDTCAVAAASMSQEMLALVRIELQRAKAFFTTKKEVKKDTSDASPERVQSFGREILEKVTWLKRKVTS